MYGHRFDYVASMKSGIHAGMVGPLMFDMDDGCDSPEVPCYVAIRTPDNIDPSNWCHDDPSVGCTLT